MTQKTQFRIPLSKHTRVRGVTENGRSASLRHSDRQTTRSVPQSLGYLAQRLALSLGHDMNGRSQLPPMSIPSTVPLVSLLSGALWRAVARCAAVCGHESGGRGRRRSAPPSNVAEGRVIEPPKRWAAYGQLRLPIRVFSARDGRARNPCGAGAFTTARNPSQLTAVL